MAQFGSASHDLVLDQAERRPDREDAAMLAAISTLEKQLCDRYRGTEMRRDAHPKHHALVEAVVLVDAADTLCHGVFGDPKRKEYEAVIRFSNSFPVVGHDLIADVRGMAIRIKGVEIADQPLLEAPGQPPLEGDNHKRQDIILTTGRAFFSKDAVDFVDFPPVAESPLGAMLYFWWPKLRLSGLKALVRAMKVPSSPLALTYFSQTPYRLGPHYVKYIARPVGHDARIRAWFRAWYTLPVVRPAIGWVLKGASWLRRWAPGENFLKGALQDYLEERDAWFELLVQRWPDNVPPPDQIEDATRVWPTWRLRPERIARIRIPLNRNIDAHSQLAERITFNPWNGFASHRPLGSINRVRREIYLAISAFRHAMNTHPERGCGGGEPRSSDIGGPVVKTP